MLNANEQTGRAIAELQDHEIDLVVGGETEGYLVDGVLLGFAQARAYYRPCIDGYHSDKRA